MDESGHIWVTKQRVHRTLVRNGRTYQAEIVPVHDGRVDVSVISVDQDDLVVSPLQAAFAPEDFELFGKVFSPAFVVVAMREHVVGEGVGVVAEIRKTPRQSRWSTD